MILTNNKIVQLEIINVIKIPLFINIKKICKIKIARKHKYN